MGMFDRLTVDLFGDTVWQTKDIGPSSQLAKYHVNADGFLQLKKEGWYDPLEIATFSETVVFYAEGPTDDSEYRAVFVNGRMTELYMTRSVDGERRSEPVQLPWMRHQS